MSITEEISLSSAWGYMNFKLVSDIPLKFNMPQYPYLKCLFHSFVIILESFMVWLFVGSDEVSSLREPKTDNRIFSGWSTAKHLATIK